MTSCCGRRQLTRAKSLRSVSDQTALCAGRGRASRRPNHKPELRLADYDIVTVFQRLTRDAAVVDRHAVSAVEVFDDRVCWTCENHGMVAHDELRVNLQIVVGSAPDGRLARENVYNF